MSDTKMEKRFDHKKIEKRIYEMWEKGGYFCAEIDKNKEPYTIVLPPPNASGKMHTGNVLMIAIEDLLIRWKRMQGYSALWLPGTDHAGFETQVIFERELGKEGKTRFDYDRDSLYKKIWDFVHENKGLIDNQMRSMGASVDWSRYTFSLDENVVDTVHSTFEKMHKEDLVYRDDYVVNYCPKCGTTFADLEVKHNLQNDPFYYVRYRLVEGDYGGKDYVVVATVRPETIFADVALAVNPKDKKKKDLVGKKVINPLNEREMEIISDRFVDSEFGTGIIKVTPAHDKNDYKIGKEHELELISVIDLDGRLNENASEFKGQTVFTGRKNIVDFLEEKGLIEKIDEKYEHSVAVCYKKEHVIEPAIFPNWFIKVDSLKKPALDVVLNGEVKIYPKWREITYTKWMEEMHDWPISRQIVWGIRVPAWYDVEENPSMIITFLSSDGEAKSGTVGDLLKAHTFEEIKKGLQTLIAPKDAKYVISEKEPKGNCLQETDTFDTWFSSGHWPFVVLGYPDSRDFKYFYPTNVLETGWEIIRLWVSRMIMFGIYLTGKPPFSSVYLHGMVRAIDGKKMSKSLGNVVNPDEYQEEYGTDALRMGLISGTANGKDFNFPHDKVLAYRNFANKVWNMARFLLMEFEKFEEESGEKVEFYDEKKMQSEISDEDKSILKDFDRTVTLVDFCLEKYRFSEAGEALYHFVWDKLASGYIEKIKERKDKGIALSVFRHVYINCLKLLHPFMPFVTEEIWSYIPKKHEEPLIVSKWPKK